MLFKWLESARCSRASLIFALLPGNNNLNILLSSQDYWSQQSTQIYNIYDYMLGLTATYAANLSSMRPDAKHGNLQIRLNIGQATKC